MKLTNSTMAAVMGAAGALVLVAFAVPQVASAAGPMPAAGGKGTPSPSPTPTASSSAYFAVGQAINIPATATAPVVVAQTKALAPGSYVANATADFFDYEANSDNNLAVGCTLKLASGAQPSFTAVQRIHTASDGSVSITWAFTNVTSSDSIVLACAPQADHSIQVSYSAITAVPVAAVTS